ncbi:hypothetical protein HX049_11335 [Myroides odoratimimus]|uniref:DUF7695 domain-containing protein n=1 Tax=Myroides odoratimimus TaxID=76832 RepID=UPI00257825AC|nr:hypothetical protein [Myroides odoratimimus]MDM1397772.1 hypothetical protein [Myroides odoratimimus]
MNEFNNKLTESRKLGNEEELKFVEIADLHRKIGLAKNERMCPKCLEIIISKYRHDFVRCECGYLGLDGGEDYTNIHLF